MLTQNELERERYLARVKLQRDELSRLHSAREEGREKGREEGLEVGQAIGVIHFCQHRLKLPQTPTDQLRTMGLEPLRKMAQQLEAELPQ